MGVCIAEACEATEVPFSSHAATGSINGTTGDTVFVVCDEGFSGSAVSTCLPDGSFSTVTCSGLALLALLALLVLTSMTLLLSLCDILSSSCTYWLYHP